MTRRSWQIEDTRGNFKNGKWVPDRTKYAKKDACGSKMKVSKCGSKMK